MLLSLIYSISINLHVNGSYSQLSSEKITIIAKVSVLKVIYNNIANYCYIATLPRLVEQNTLPSLTEQNIAKLIRIKDTAMFNSIKKLPSFIEHKTLSLPM